MKNLLGQDQTAEITSSDSDFSEEDEYDYSLQDEEVLVPKVKPWDVFEVSDSLIIIVMVSKVILKYIIGQTS